MTASLIVAGVILAALIATATWALATGLRERARARSALLDRARLARLVDHAPLRPLLVRSDGRVETTAAAAEWLGLNAIPTSLADLASRRWRLTPADGAALLADIAAARSAARSFSRVVTLVGGQPLALAITGERVETDVICWLADATAAEAQRAELTADRDELAGAFEALAMLIEAAPLPMWYRAPDLALTMVNSAYVDAVEGADAATAIARQLELLEGSGEAGARVGAIEAQRLGRPHERIAPVTINGARRSLRIVDVPLPSGGVAGYAIDVEELEQATAREKRFAEAQRTTLDRLSAGVAQFARDRSLIFCNQPFRRMFAMRREWLTDRPEFDRVLERMREAGRVPEVRDFPGWKAERRDWFIAAEGAAEENWHLPGGTHLRVLAQPLPDGGLLLVFEDRTEQVQLASARDTLLRVRTATFDNLFEALGVFAADGRLQLWNNRFRKLWGFEEEFLAGHPRVDAIAERIAPMLAHPRRARFVSEIVRAATTGRRQRAGSVALADGRHFEFAAVPLPDGNALFTLLDVSDSRRIEHALRDRNEALEAADRVKTAFVANMSYELRTPLTSISGFAEMLAAGYAGALGVDAEQYVGAILESVDRLGTLVDDVLNLTQGSPDGGAASASFTLNTLARAAADAVRASATRRRVELVTEAHPSAGEIVGDTDKLGEMIQHLLRHAIGAAGEGGRVLLHLDGDATQARVVVSDDGPGMSADVAARAFDRFAHAGGMRGQERALGLGLPLAKQFVEAHGGTIELVSEPGAGTVITAHLPRWTKPQ